MRHALVQQIVKAYEATHAPSPTHDRARGAGRTASRLTSTVTRRRGRRARLAPRLGALARTRGAARARAAPSPSRSSPIARDAAAQPAVPQAWTRRPTCCRFRRRGRRSPGPEPQARRSDLGDIAIALGVAARQARADGHALATELRILALHGLLHLLGYDHETDQGQMRTAGGAAAAARGLPAGLIPGARADRRLDDSRSSSFLLPPGCCSSRSSRRRSALLMRLPQRLEAERESESDALAAYLDDPLQVLRARARDARHAARRSSIVLLAQPIEHGLAGLAHAASRSGVGDRRSASARSLPALIVRAIAGARARAPAAGVHRWSPT